MANPKPTRQTFKTQAERLADDNLARLRLDAEYRLRSIRVHVPYDGKELRDSCNRPGAVQAQATPSRQGDTLHYRDGSRVFDPIPEQPPIDPYAAFTRG